MSSATATGIRCIAEKKKSWQPSTGMSPKRDDPPVAAQEPALPAHRPHQRGREDQTGDAHAHEQRRAERPARFQQRLDERPARGEGQSGCHGEHESGRAHRAAEGISASGRCGVGAAMVDPAETVRSEICVHL